MDTARLNELTGRIIEAAMRVHSTLGPGLLESTYQACLLYELTKAGLKTIPQVLSRSSTTGSVCSIWAIGWTCWSKRKSSSN
jgi:PD-(D/E)XK nuclease superfamily